MKKNRNKILLLFLVCTAIIGGTLFFYVYKEHRDISKEEARFTISAHELHKQFQTNDSLANELYADQTIVVSGLVTSFDPNTKALIVDEKLFLTFRPDEVLNLQAKQLVTIKGRFVGYDDLMEELKMDQCQLIE